MRGISINGIALSIIGISSIAAAWRRPRRRGITAWRRLIIAASRHQRLAAAYAKIIGCRGSA